MSNYLGIHHCEILVTDVDKAMHFYTQLLGMEEIHNPSTFQASKWLRLGNQELHLTFDPTPDANKERHFAIHVKSLQQLREDFQAKGVEIVEAGTISGVQRFFIFDPFDNRIEFVEREASKTQDPNVVVILNRTLKPGQTFENFYEAWKPPVECVSSEGHRHHYHYFSWPSRVINMQNAANPNEIISLGLLYCESEEQFHTEMKRLAATEQIRHDKIAKVADKMGENRQYFVLSDDILG